MARGERKEETTIKGLIGREGKGHGREEMWIPLRLQKGVGEEVL